MRGRASDVLFTFFTETQMDNIAFAKQLIDALDDFVFELKAQPREKVKLLRSVDEKGILDEFFIWFDYEEEE